MLPKDFLFHIYQSTRVFFTFLESGQKVDFSKFYNNPKFMSSFYNFEPFLRKLKYFRLRISSTFCRLSSYLPFKQRKYLANVFTGTHHCVRCVVFRVGPSLKNKSYFLIAKLKVFFMQNNQTDSLYGRQSRLFSTCGYCFLKGRLASETVIKHVKSYFYRYFSESIFKPEIFQNQALISIHQHPSRLFSRCERVLNPFCYVTISTGTP